MTTVVDASVATSCIADDRFSEAARDELETATEGEEKIAPAFLLLELHSALAKRFAAGELSTAQLAEAPSIIETLIRLVPFDAKIGREALLLSMGGMRTAMEERDGRPLPSSPYDCAYVALALARDAELVTADRRQYSIALRVGCRARLLA